MCKEAFLEAMSKASNTVNVVTTDGLVGSSGVTVSAMCSVSADRPTVLVCVHHLSPAAYAIRENGVFCVNVLKDDQSHISDTFAGRLKREDGDKFGCAAWNKLETGSPVLGDGLAAFDCKLVQATRWDTHWMFLGEVVAVATEDDTAMPLIHVQRSYATPQLAVA